MTRRTAPLTVDRLAELPTRCRSCLFWELDPVRRQRVPAEDAAEEKEGWVSGVLREWGSCGRVALVDDRVVGYVIYAPTAYVPGIDSLPDRPGLARRGRDDDRARRPGAHRRWHRPIADPGDGARPDQARGVRAVEAFADTRGVRGHCLVPAEFCGRVGFKTQRAHPTTPRLRMDLRTALTWRDEVEQALERLVRAMRPIVRPAPKASGPRPGARRSESVTTVARRLVDRRADQADELGDLVEQRGLGARTTMDFTTSPPW